MYISELDTIARLTLLKRASSVLKYVLCYSLFVFVFLEHQLVPDRSHWHKLLAACCFFPAASAVKQRHRISAEARSLENKASEPGSQAAISTDSRATTEQQLNVHIIHHHTSSYTPATENSGSSPPDYPPALSVCCLSFNVFWRGGSFENRK